MTLSVASCVFLPSDVRSVRIRVRLIPVDVRILLRIHLTLGCLVGTHRRIALALACAGQGIWVWLLRPSIMPYAMLEVWRVLVVIVCHCKACRKRGAQSTYSNCSLSEGASNKEFHRSEIRSWSKSRRFPQVIDEGNVRSAAVLESSSAVSQDAVKHSSQSEHAFLTRTTLHSFICNSLDVNT